MLSFVIPVRHYLNARDWTGLTQRLAQTIGSINAQDSSEWNAVIVANTGSDLPALPPSFSVKWVDFPPNALYVRGTADKESFNDAVRADKGRRILAGIQHLAPSGHIMIVDDDDFVSRRLAGFVYRHQPAFGWYLNRGFLWEENRPLMCAISRFHHLCGTSHIVRADLYKIPPTWEDTSEEYIRRMLGSHVFIDGVLKENGTPLQPLPFIGAVYRIGHAGAHSNSRGILHHIGFSKSAIRHPLRTMQNVLGIRMIGDALREEFFNGSHATDGLAAITKLPPDAESVPPPRSVSPGSLRDPHQTSSDDPSRPEPA